MKRHMEKHDIDKAYVSAYRVLMSWDTYRKVSRSWKDQSKRRHQYKH